MQRTLHGWSYPSNQKQIRLRRQEMEEEGSMINDLQYVPSYRKLLWNYAVRRYRSDPSTCRRYRQLLAKHPCLLEEHGPHPEYQEDHRTYQPWITVRRDREFIPWWKLRKWKDAGKGKVSEEIYNEESGDQVD